MSGVEGRCGLCGQPWSQECIELSCEPPSAPTEQADVGVVGWPEDTKDWLIEEVAVTRAAARTGLGDGLIRASVRAYLDAARDNGLHPFAPPATPIAGGLTDLSVHVPADWLQGIWNMGNDALKRLPSDPQGALVSLTGAMMALHPLISKNCQHDAAARRDEEAGQ